MTSAVTEVEAWAGAHGPLLSLLQVVVPVALSLGLVLVPALWRAVIAARLPSRARAKVERYGAAVARVALLIIGVALVVAYLNVDTDKNSRWLSVGAFLLGGAAVYVMRRGDGRAANALTAPAQTAVAELERRVAATETSDLALQERLATVETSYAETLAFVNSAIAAARAAGEHAARLEAMAASALQRHGDELAALQKAQLILLDPVSALTLGNWSYYGKWSVDRGNLVVAGDGSGQDYFGGVFSGGHEWIDYDFSFEFRIERGYAGWFVRTNQERSSGALIQIHGGGLRPHLPASVNGEVTFLRVFFDPAAEDREFVLPAPLSGWNRALTQVRANKVTVWINGQFVWESGPVLGGSGKGTVGLRCCGQEHALFRSIRVERR